MIEKLRKFMTGRYGIDQLSQALNIIFLILALTGLLMHQSIFLILALIPMFYNYYRMFSKNFQKRYNENRIYTNMTAPIYNFFQRLKLKFRKKQKRDKVNYKYYRCKNCGQELRIPRGKGKVVITCPICKHSFEGRS